MAQNASTTSTPKRCPGVAPVGILPHELAATSENFSSNRAAKDGLATRCRPCDQRYIREWNAAKKRGEKFSVKAGAPIHTEAMERALNEPAPRATLHVDGSEVFMATAKQRAEREQAAAGESPAVAKRRAQLPQGKAVETPAGQAALAAAAAAEQAARRAAGAEAKRRQRAAKKLREQELAGEAAANA